MKPGRQVQNRVLTLIGSLFYPGCHVAVGCLIAGPFVHATTPILILELLALSFFGLPSIPFNANFSTQLITVSLLAGQGRPPGSAVTKHGPATYQEPPGHRHNGDLLPRRTPAACPLINRSRPVVVPQAYPTDFNQHGP